MRTITQLGKTVEDELDPAYTLVYAEQGQILPDDVAAALVRGDNEWETAGGERLQEWVADTSWVSARDTVDQLAMDIVRRWEREDSTNDTDADYSELVDNEWPSSDERQAMIDMVTDRGDSGWFDTLIQQHGLVLLRVSIATMDEDAGLSFTSMTPAQFLDLLGFEKTDGNLSLAGEVVDNASPEFTVAMGYALIGVDLTDIVALPTVGAVTLVRPHVWLGSPFSGSGWCSEEPFEGTLTVDRGDLRTDSDAFGYSWSAVVGGVSPTDFAAGSLTPT